MENTANNNLVIDIDNLQTFPSDMGIARFEKHHSPSLNNLFSNREVLARRLKNRPDRDDLIDRHIMPAHAATPSIYDKVTQLERKKTGDIIQRKIRVRPSRQQLVQRHILSDTRADPSLLDSLGKLERQRIADNLNERLLLRPGPIELIHDHILPVDSPIQNAIEHGNVLFDQSASPASSTTDSPSLSELETGLTTLNCTSPSPPPQDLFNGFSKKPLYQTTSLSTSKSSENFDRIIRSISTDSSVSPTQSSTQISLSQKENEKLVRMINKKSRPTKPKVKKLKFHECRPPDMPSTVLNENNEVDVRYKRLLEQQTLYLRLQVMQQNAMLNALQGNPESMHAVTEEIENVVDKERGSTSSETLVKSLEGKKLDDLRVIDLRAQLKQRGLLVSGSKAKLIERLTAFEEGKATAADFSYLVNNSINESMQCLPATTAVEMTPATTVMQVTTYSTSAGQTYQVVQAVPQSPQNVMQYQVLPANYVSNQTMPQIQLSHVNLQPVVNISQPNVMTIHESVAGISPKTQIPNVSTPSQMQFQFSPPPQQPSPTIVLQPSPNIQRAAVIHHEKPRMQVMHMPVLRQGNVYHSKDVTYMSNASQLSQSFPSNCINNDLSNMSGNINSLNNTMMDEMNEPFRGRASSEPSSHFKIQGNSYLKQNGLNISQSNTKLNSLYRDSSPTVDQMRTSGQHPSLSQVLYEQQKSPGTMKSPENYDDIMDIIGELTTPLPTNVGSPLPPRSCSNDSSMSPIKPENPPPYNSCLYDSSKQKTNKFLNVTKQFSSVPEQINVLSGSPSQNYLNSPYGSLDTNSLSGSLSNLQLPNSGSYGNLNHSSSTGNIPQSINQCSSYQNIHAPSPYHRSPCTTPSNYIKMEYNPNSPISMPDDNLGMDIDNFQSSNIHNNTLNWLDLNVDNDPPPLLNYQGMQTKEVTDMNPNVVQHHNSLFGNNNNNRTQTSLYGSSPRNLDHGFISLFDLEGGEF